MIPMLAVTFFVFGLIIGSFLNVVIYRINTSRSLGGRCACMSCQSKLAWHELIPLFSFFALRGRCRTCKTRISIQYPLVEFATGFIFAMIFLKFRDFFFINIPMFSISFAYYAFMFSLLIVIAVYDFKHKIIPDNLVFIFGILSFIGIFFVNGAGLPAQAGLSAHMPSIFDFLSGVFIALPFYLFWFISNGRWMGLGDAKLVLGIGWFLGLGTALSAVAIAFWTGALAGLYLVIFSRKKYGMKSEIPFASYLFFGTILAFIFDLQLFGPF